MKHLWRQILRGNIVERELDDELRFHVERETEANLTLTPMQALRLD
jgi:hypothetical protein